jgi:ABC-type uncharacterized transport system auxiliary subunit
MEVLNMKKLLLLILLLLTLASCRTKTEDNSIIDTYVNEIVECNGWERYAYTVQKVEGKFDLTDAEEVYAITFYTADDEVITYLVWHKGSDVDWQELKII